MSLLDQYMNDEDEKKILDTLPEKIDILEKVEKKPVKKAIKKKNDNSVEVEEKREQLSILSVLGTIDSYTGIKMSLDNIKKLTPGDIEKYYNRYQVVLGSKITSGLVDTAIQASVGLMSYVVPIDSRDELCYDLQKNEMLIQELNNIVGYFLLKGGRMVALSLSLIQVVKHMLNLVQMIK